MSEMNDKARELVPGDDYYYIPNQLGGESYQTMEACVAARGSGWLVCDHRMIDRYRDLSDAYDALKAELAGYKITYDANLEERDELRADLAAVEAERDQIVKVARQAQDACLDLYKQLQAERERSDALEREMLDHACDRCKEERDQARAEVERLEHNRATKDKNRERVNRMYEEICEERDRLRAALEEISRFVSMETTDIPTPEAQIAREALTAAGPRPRNITSPAIEARVSAHGTGSSQDDWSEARGFPDGPQDESQD